MSYNEQGRIWYGPPPSHVSAYKDDTSLGEIIFNNMRNWPKKVCQISDSDGVRVTADQALTWAIRLAQFLRKRGLTHKDVIGIVGENTTYLMPLAVACLMNGTPFHTPHPMLDEDTLRHVLSITKPGLIFCDGNIYHKVHSATSGWQPEFFTLSDHPEGVPSIETLLEPTSTEDSYHPEPLREGGDQTVAVLCSSGTTGLPKAVCISNKSLLPMSLFTSDTIMFTLTALDWYSGLVAFILSTLVGGTRIITNKPFTPEYVAHLVAKHGVNFIYLAPRHMSAMFNSPDVTPEAFASLRTVTYGGGKLSKSTVQRCQDLCRNAILLSMYGMTETGTLTCSVGLEPGSSVGKLLPAVTARIVDEQGRSLQHNQVGEIQVQTGRVWRGYFGNPEATESMRDSKGWFHTGDMGYFDEQNQLYVVDRCKEILKHQAVHFWPGEIESVILELNKVQEVCVVGIPNELTDYDAGALVVRKKGAAIDAQEIVEHVAKRLPGVHKQLHAGVQFTNELPSNLNGKTVRRASRELFSAIKYSKKTLV
ncbi:4-coumarate--CoA ligase-like 7 [Drosophila serrata]|uniref:4-coumarate--CoA ligase-like 7 n=1 Tax=Drosophila serrata TaxID=7274 RepID=UPI000A1D03FB|nr:4-coumarate--CoA ligase-like 7 [Drosophila serrata]